MVWNRSREKTAPLAERGAEVAASPAAVAASCDLVLTMVSDPEALLAVTEGTDGVAAGVAGDTVVAEMSTVGPQAVTTFAAALPHGTALVDAPVLGSLSEVEQGTLTVFVGGPSDVVERIRPALESLGTVFHVGPLGAGAAAKLVANTTLFGTLATLGEAIALADGLGLERDIAFRVLGVTPLAIQAQRRRPALEGEENPPRFALSLARKDAGLIDDAAVAAGLDLRVVAAARTWLDDAVAAGFGDRDYSTVLAQIVAQRE